MESLSLVASGTTTQQMVVLVVVVVVVVVVAVVAIVDLELIHSLLSMSPVIVEINTESVMTSSKHAVYQQSKLKFVCCLVRVSLS